MNDNQILNSLLLGLLLLLLPAAAKPATAARPTAHEAPPLLQADPIHAATADAIAKRLDALDWDGGRVAILVQDADYPITLFAHRPGELTYPGSLLQVLTAAAALDRLGPLFVYHTELRMVPPAEAGAPPRGLVVRGSGDPSFGRRQAPGAAHPEPLPRWCEVLGERGIEKIEGTLLGDDRMFERSTYGPGWPTDDLANPRVPCVGALNFHANCVHIEWSRGGRVNKPAPYNAYPDLPGFITLQNNVFVTEAAPVGRRFTRIEQGNLFAMHGDLKAGQAETDRLAVGDPTRFALLAIKSALADCEVEVTGPAISAWSLRLDELPTRTLTLDVHESPPLWKLLETMLRDDDTLTAEAVLKTMGHEAGGGREAGGFENGARTVNRWLDGLHIPGATRRILDGSGLSRLNALSPTQLVYAMRETLDGEQGAYFAALFPRLELHAARSSPISVHGKQASAFGSEGRAGWFRTREQNTVLFAIMVQGSRLPGAVLARQVDELLADIHDACGGS